MARDLGLGRTSFCVEMKNFEVFMDLPASSPQPAALAGLS